MKFGYFQFWLAVQAKLNVQNRILLMWSELKVTSSSPHCIQQLQVGGSLPCPIGIQVVGSLGEGSAPRSRKSEGGVGAQSPTQHTKGASGRESYISSWSIISYHIWRDIIMCYRVSVLSNQSGNWCDLFALQVMSWITLQQLVPIVNLSATCVAVYRSAIKVAWANKCIKHDLFF